MFVVHQTFFIRVKITRSIAAEDGCTSNTNLHAADQWGSSLVCFFYWVLHYNYRKWCRPWTICSIHFVDFCLS